MNSKLPENAAHFSTVTPPVDGPMTQSSPVALQMPSGASWFRRLLFRGGTIYLLLYNFSWMTRLLPGPDWPARLWSKLWLAVTPWVGRHLLRIPYQFSGASNGSGDKTSDYVQLVCLLALGLLGGFVWAWFDRKRRHDDAVHDLLRTSVRYVLACAMLLYGFSKVFHQQMPLPGAGRLMQPYGESSPMGLLWTFMGYSAAYSLFAGAAEVLGGVLVLFRRTATLGALVIFVAMLNVTLMNFCFDVPVKLFALHLVFMAIFLMTPDLKRLWCVFIANRSAPAADLKPCWSVNRRKSGDGQPPESRQSTLKTIIARLWAWRTGLALALKVFVIGWLFYSALQPHVKRLRAGSPKSELVGLYKVEGFARDGKSMPLLITDKKLWHRVGVDSYGVMQVMTVRTMNDTAQRFILVTDSAKHELKLTTRGVAQPKPIVLTYKWADADKLVIEGPFDGETVSVLLRRADASQYLLMNRGFHWINEAPFNR